MSILLDVKDLRVDLPTEQGMLHAVRGIDFQVRRGEMLCLVGESGCGKSMTSLALMGLLPRKAQRSAAHIRFDGVDLQQLPERKMADLRGQRMAMIFQDPMTSLNPSYTLGNQLCEALLQHRQVSHAEARERAIYLLHRTGIKNAEDRLRQYPHQLSGGLRQRVMIAMALALRPQLMVMDEPTTALDVLVQREILKQISQLRHDFGFSVVFITHDLPLLLEISDRIAIMRDGEIVELATAEQIWTNPQHEYTQKLLQSFPRLTGERGVVVR